VTLPEKGGKGDHRHTETREEVGTAGKKNEAWKGREKGTILAERQPQVQRNGEGLLCATGQERVRRTWNGLDPGNIGEKKLRGPLETPGPIQKQISVLPREIHFFPEGRGKIIQSREGKTGEFCIEGGFVKKKLTRSKWRAGTC